MQSVITVIVKDSEKSMRYKFLIYDPYSVSDSDPIIKKCVDDAVSHFGPQPEDIKVKIDLEIV